MAEAEFIRERELIEKIQEKKNENKGNKELKRLFNQEEEDEGFTIYPEDLTPVYSKVRFLKKDVLGYKQSIDNKGLTEVSFKFDEDFMYIKCTIEEFDRIFFKKRSFKEWIFSIWQ